MKILLSAFRVRLAGGIMLGALALASCKMRWSSRGAQKQDVYFLSHDRKKEQDHAG